MITLTASSPHSTKNLTFFPTGIEPATTPVYRVGCVIITTQRKQAKYLSKMICPYLKSMTLFLTFWAAAFCFEQVSLPRNGSEWNSDSLLLFVPRNGIPSCFLFRLRGRKGIPRVCFYFCFHGTEFRVFFSSAEVFGTEFREFASIFVQRNGIPSCFLFRGKVRNGIPRFSVPRNIRNSVGNNHSVYSVFRGIIFWSEIPNPTHGPSIFSTRPHFTDTF
jgi:hypothetical protein